MSGAKRVLLLGGITLALLGMTYGLWYAAFVEHQALDGMRGSLASSFSSAANRNLAQSADAMAHYRQAKYNYDRQVDAHSHWIGLAMVVILLGIGFDHIRLSRKSKLLLAWGLLIGAALFPFGVLLQTVSQGAVPKLVAVVGSGMVVFTLAAAAVGFVRRPVA